MQRGCCKGGCKERARETSSARSRRVGNSRVERERERGGEREGKKRRKREKDVVRLDFSTFDGEETEKPGRLHGAAEKVANSKTFRGPIISDETIVRHQGGCPVYLDL